MTPRPPDLFREPSRMRLRLEQPDIVPRFVREPDEIKRHLPRRSALRSLQSREPFPRQKDIGMEDLYERLRKHRLEYYADGDTLDVFAYSQNLEMQLGENEEYLFRVAKGREALPSRAQSLIVSEQFSRTYLGILAEPDHLISRRPFGNRFSTSEKPSWKNPIPKVVILHRPELVQAVENIRSGRSYGIMVKIEPATVTVDFQEPRHQTGSTTNTPQKNAQLYRKYLFPEDDHPWRPAEESKPPLQFGENLKSMLEKMPDPFLFKENSPEEIEQAAVQYFIGGGRDKNDFWAREWGATNVMGDVTPAGGHYRGHEQKDEIIKEIKENYVEGQKIDLIGHSWGGQAAIEISEALGEDGIQVNNLITLDPVSLFSQDTKNYNVWINVYQKQTWLDLIATIPLLGNAAGAVLSGVAMPSESVNFDDTIATMGGQLGKEAGAINIVTELHHVEAEEMYQLALEELSKLESQ